MPRRQEAPNDQQRLWGKLSRKAGWTGSSVGSQENPGRCSAWENPGIAVCSQTGVRHGVLLTPGVCMHHELYNGQPFPRNLWGSLTVRCKSTRKELATWGALVMWYHDVSGRIDHLWTQKWARLDHVISQAPGCQICHSVTLTSVVS